MDLQAALQSRISASVSISNVNRIQSVRDALPREDWAAFNSYLLGYLAASVTSEEMTEAFNGFAQYKGLMYGLK